MQEEERKVTLTTTREIGKCWWWMSWRCTTALSSWRTSSNWTEMPTAGTKGVITSSSTTDLEMLRVETDSFKSVDTLTLSTQGIYHLHGIIFILYLWHRKISPLCHLSVTTCTQVRLFDPTWLLTSILHAKVYGTIHSYIVAHIEAGCKWVPISYFFSLWKPRNERNYASNKKSGLKGKRSAAPLKRPTVMKELNKNH